MRGFRALRVVAQRGHRLAAALEVHGELRWRPPATPAARSPSRAAPTLRWSWARERRGGALVQHLPEQGMPERVRQLRRIVPFLDPRGRQPDLLARERLACLDRPRRRRARVQPPACLARNSTPQTAAAAEHHALLVPEPGDVVIDDGRQILRHRHVCESRRGSSVLVVRRCVRYHLAHDGRHEQRHAVRALVQRTHERLVARRATASACATYSATSASENGSSTISSHRPCRRSSCRSALSG